MAAFKDGKKWEVRFYYNYNGKRKQKHKRGFSTKKEALEWEREFLLESNFSMNMKFKSLYSLYMKDMKHRIKEGTYLKKENIFENRILPYFEDMEVSQISAAVIRRFQNKLISAVNDKTNKEYSGRYIKNINSELAAIFNYAVNFHNLRENPVKKAGPLKLQYPKKMNIWTLEEFNKFLKVIADKPVSYAGFSTLFWTGIRLGELLALTRKDIDLKKKTITINKSYSKLQGKEIIGSPKTESSNRVIKMPDVLVSVLQNYLDSLYDLSSDDRIFPVSKYLFRNDLNRHHKKAGVKRITPHDLRHSHASLLINNNVNILVISKRLGHSKIDETLNTYSHLYQSSEEAALKILNQYT